MLTLNPKTENHNPSTASTLWPRCCFAELLLAELLHVLLPSCFFVFVLGPGVLGPGSRVLRFLKAKACPATPCSGCGSSSAPLPASQNAVYPPRPPVSALAVELIGPKSVQVLPSWPVFVEDSALARRSPCVSLKILGKSWEIPYMSS